MAVTNNPYCDLSSVKAALALSTTTDDAWIQALIVQAQADIDAYIGYSFQTDGPGTTRKFDGWNSDTLLIDDCQAVTQVLETTYNAFLGANGVWVSGTSQTVDITADCILLPNNTIPGYELARISGVGFLPGRANYAITGTWGQPSVPAPIARACVRLTVHYYKMRQTGYTDMVADGQFGRGIKFLPSMPDDVVQILERWRRHSFYARS